MRTTVVDEVNWGLYMWMMPDESLVMDDEGGYLCIPSLKGDIRQIKKLRDVAKYHGLEEGKPIFFSGHRQITNDELLEQQLSKAITKIRIQDTVACQLTLSAARKFRSTGPSARSPDITRLSKYLFASPL